ncbi:MAG: hypothetical protein IJ590_04990 [Rickettsiales bacterium]|nr:hypothetical protein [Rickettsiales bacterium]
MVQHISKFEEIRTIVRRSITASFLLTSIINLMFLGASGYTYFIFNSLAKNVNWQVIIVPTVEVVLLFVFGQILQIKRNTIVFNIARFLDSITFNNFIKLGIILNRRQNSVQPSQKLMQDVLMIKNFILQKGLIGIFEIPWCIIAIAIIGYLSRINLIICTTCLVVLAAILLLQKHSLRDDILDISHNDTKNDDNLSEIFKNYQYISSNVDIENLVAYYAEINEQYFTKNEATRRKFEIWQSASKIVVSVSQTAIFLCSVFMLIYHHFSFGEFILTNILAGKTLTMMERCVYSILPFKNVKMALSRIADALQKVATTTSNAFIPSDTTVISLIDVSHKDLQNISCDLEGGNIYVIQGLSEATTADFLKLVGGIITPKGGKINCFNNENGYKFLHYCPDKVVFPEARIVDIITGFSEVDKMRIDNILQMLNFKSEIDKLEYGIYTLLHQFENLSLTFMKKINLAAMLYSNANVVILEEPFKYLDEIAIENLVISLNTMQKIGKLVVISCSDESLIRQLNNVNLIKFVD